MAWLEKRQRRSYWQAVFRDAQGTLRKRSLKVPLEERALAEEKLKEYQEAAQSREMEAAAINIIEAMSGKKTPIVHIPVAKLWEFFLSRPQPQKVIEATQKTKKNHILSWIKWMSKKYPLIDYLDQITPQIAEAYIVALKEKSGQTVNNKLSCLKSVFAVVRNAAGLKQNVWDTIPRVAANNIKKKDLNLEQIEILYNEAFKLTARVADFWPAAILLGFYGGLRLGDVCTLSWNEIDFEKGLISILPNKTKKYEKPVVFPMSAELKAIIFKQKGSHIFVWPDIAKAYNVNHNWLFDEWNELCKVCGIETFRKTEEGENRVRGVKEFGFHSLRHAHRTIGREFGATAEDLRDTGGWSTLKMSDHYDHSLGAGQRVAEKLPKIERKKNMSS